MPQTSTIAFALIVGFIVFVTVRGELPTYLGVIGLGSKVVNPPGVSSAGSSVSPASATSALQVLPALIGV